ncbi:tetratricopeptide repeat protein [Salinarimonas rosea]|uniref:tetratricopeptide repeat protein n=1 Tax=Salinarimonas rosea TaxID=552063 RepID=UPI0003FE89F5|nr:tetratricopeptide repeat protein [Salinarimonas rosea]
MPIIRLPGRAALVFATALLAATLAGGGARDAQARDVVEPARSLSGNFLAGYVAGLARDPTAAATFLREALLDDPSNPELMERAFVAFLADGSMPDAMRTAERMIALDPQNGLALLALGVDDLRNARFGEALARFEDGTGSRAADLTATLLAAWAHAGARDGKAALEALDRLAGEPAFEIFRLYHGGLLASFLGMPDEAEERLAAAYGMQPTALSIVDAYARHVARRGRTEEAIGIYEAFLAQVQRHALAEARIDALRAGERPGRPATSIAAGAAEVLYALGSAGNAQGDEMPTIIYLRLALHLAPEHEMSLITLADVFARMDRPEDAILLYEQVSRTSPLNVDADIEVAHLLERLERNAEAESRLRMLMADRPDDLEVVTALANILRVRQQWNDAARYYTRAIELIGAPTAVHWPLFYFRGASYERAKQWPKAEADLERALELVPEGSSIGRAQVLNYLGYSWVDMGINIDEAFDMLKEAVSLSPRDGMIIDSLGWAYYRLGRWEDAVRELERAVELQPSDPVINDHLGDAYWRVGRRLEARFQWQHALDNDPEPEEREAILRKLEHGLEDEPAPEAAQAPRTGANGG